MAPSPIYYPLRSRGYHRLLQFVAGEVWAMARGKSVTRVKVRPGDTDKAVLKKPTAKPSVVAVKKVASKAAKSVPKKVIQKQSSKRDGRRAHK